MNWGSRNASVFDEHGNKAGPPAFTAPRSSVRNPSYWVDYQDCKFLGQTKHYGDRSVMLCSGVTNLYGVEMGGLAIVDTKTMVPLDEVPITMKTETGKLVTENPMDAAIVDGKLRVYWLPVQHNCTLYAYEAQPDSPFEFGGGPQ
jgi:hypothetical protein